MSEELQPSKVDELWKEIRLIIDSIDLDVRKNSKGNVSAGIRSRRGLRLLKKQATSLVKVMIQEERNKKEK